MENILFFTDGVASWRSYPGISLWHRANYHPSGQEGLSGGRAGSLRCYAGAGKGESSGGGCCHQLGERGLPGFYPHHVLQQHFSSLYTIALLLTKKDLEKCLARVWEHLLLHGRFIFSVFNPSLSILSQDPEQEYPLKTYPHPYGQGMVTVTE